MTDWMASTLGRTLVSVAEANRALDAEADKVKRLTAQCDWLKKQLALHQLHDYQRFNPEYVERWLTECGMPE